MFLRWAVIFFVIAIIAGLFGFTGVAAAATGIAKVLFFIFLAGFLIAFLFYLFVAIKMYRLGKSFGAPTQSNQKPKIRDLN